MAEVLTGSHYTSEDIKFILERKRQNTGLKYDNNFFGANDFQSIAFANDGKTAYALGNSGGNLHVWKAEYPNLFDFANPVDVGFAYNGAELITVDARGFIFIKANAFGSPRTFVGYDDTAALAANWFVYVDSAYFDFNYTTGTTLDLFFDHKDNCCALAATATISNTIYRANMGAFANKIDLASSNFTEVDFDTNNYIYVLNGWDDVIGGDDKIYRYTHDGTPIDSWLATVPTAFAIADKPGSYQYVYTTSASFLYRYNLDGTAETTIDNIPGGITIVDMLHCVEWDYEGDRIFITYTINGGNRETIIEVRHALTGEIIKYITIQIKDNTQTIRDIRYRGGYLYFINPDTTRDYITKMDIETEEQTDIYDANSYFTGLDFDTAGFLYLSTNYQIDKINSETGTLAVTFGSIGSGDGQLNGAKRVRWFRRTNMIYVADNGNNRIQWFKYGKIISNIGSTGTGDGEFDTPSSITADDDGKIYVADNGNNRIQIFDRDFTHLSNVALTDVLRIRYSTVLDKFWILKENDLNLYLYEKDFSLSEKAPTLGDASLWGQLIVYEDTIVTYKFSTPSQNDMFIYNYNFEQEQIDITRDVIFNSDFNITADSEASKFSLGKFTIGGVDFTLNNSDGKYNAEYFESSIFYDADNNYQRNLSKITIKLKDKDLYSGLIDGKNCVQEENKISLKTFSPFKYLNDTPFAPFSDVVVNGDTISDILEKCINTLYFNEYINYTASDIDLYYDAVIDDISKLPDTVGEIIDELGSAGKYSFGAYGGNNFYAYSYIDKMETRTLDYILDGNHLLADVKFNFGEQRFFKRINVTNEITKATYEINPRIQLIYNEEREKDFNIDAITTGATLEQVAADYEKIMVVPTKEYDITLPLFLPADEKYYNKVFAFNLFDAADRGLAFNIPALAVGNTLLNTKESALDELNSGEKVLYYVLGYKIILGNKFLIEFKIKEMVDDTYGG